MFGRRKTTTVPTTRSTTDYKSTKQIKSSTLSNTRAVEQNKSFAPNISNRPIHLFQSGDKLTTNSSLNTTTVPGADPGKGVKPTDEPSGLSTQMAIILGLGLSLVFVLIVCLILFAVSRTLSNKKDKKKGKKEDGGGGKHRSEDSESQSGTAKQNSLVKDLPSTDVQSIVMENKELKPVKSEVFRWKSKLNRSPVNGKNKRAKNNPKDNPKEQPKDKPKEKRAINKDKLPKKDNNHKKDNNDKKDKKGRNEKRKGKDGKDGKANKN